MACPVKHSRSIRHALKVILHAIHVLAGQQEDDYQKQSEDQMEAFHLLVFSSVIGPIRLSGPIGLLTTDEFFIRSESQIARFGRES